MALHRLGNTEDSGNEVLPRATVDGSEIWLTTWDGAKTYLKPGKEWEKLPTSTGAGFQPSTVPTKIP